MSISISYLITCSNETRTLRNLLKRVYYNISLSDELVILIDSGCTNNDETKSIINGYLRNYPNINCLTRDLSGNYSLQKNYGSV